MRLGLLGPLSIEGDPAFAGVLRQPKRSALLIYLACRHGTPIPRHTLLAMFWPETDEAHARDALNSALRFLRKQLGESAIPSLPGDTLAVDPAVMETDVAQFTAALAAGRPHEALALYRGPFLEGFHTDAPGFDEWLDEERTRLHALATGASHVVAERTMQEGLAEPALTAALKWATLAPGDEQAALQVLAVLHAVGDRGGALEVWDNFVARLEREYDAEPSREARAEVDRVRHGGAPRHALQTVPLPVGTVPDDGHQLPRAPVTHSPLATRRRTGWLAGAGGVLLAVAMATTSGRWSTWAPSVDIAQLTISGQARWPMLSPDGTEVVYSQIECDESNRCRSALIITDVAGESPRVIVRAAANLAPLFWTLDGGALAVRSLTPLQGVTADPATDWPPGAYLVPLDGQRPRWIGCCEASRGADPDTIAIMQQGVDIRVRFMTLSDGVVHDSLRFPSGTGAFRLEVSPNLRFFLMGRTIYDRGGGVVDQLPLDPPACGFGPAEWSQDGRAILYSRCHQRTEALAVLLRQGVAPDGRLEGAPDTVITSLPLSSTYPFMDVSDDGRQLVYLNGRENVSMALRRGSTRDSVFQSRPLASSFHRIHSLPSPDGRQVMIGRVIDPDSVVWALSVMPIDSGPEVPLGEFRRLQMGRLDWAPDSKALLGFVERAGDGALELLRMDAASGRRTSLAVLPSDGRTVNDVHALPGGGMAVGIRDSSMSGFRRYLVPGMTDTVFALPPVQSFAGLLAVSPDGREVAAFGQDGARYYLEAVNLTNGARRRLVTGGVSPMLRPFWFTDGSLLFPSLGPWQILTPEGELRRLGEPPFPMANFHFSEDGLTGVANLVSNRGNVFIVRNFGKLRRN